MDRANAGMTSVTSVAVALAALAFVLWMASYGIGPQGLYSLSVGG